MKKDSQLNKYKDPKKQMTKIAKWVKANYKAYTFRLHKEKDKELIKLIDDRKGSIADILRKALL